MNAKHHPDLQKSYGTGDRSSAIRSSRRRSWTGCCIHSTRSTFGARSYRLKDRRKAGLVPPRGQEGAEAAARSLASDSVPPKRAKRRRWAPLVRGQGGPFMKVQGWGIFDRTMRNFQPELTTPQGKREKPLKWPTIEQNQFSHESSFCPRSTTRVDFFSDGLQPHSVSPKFGGVRVKLSRTTRPRWLHLNR